MSCRNEPKDTSKWRRYPDSEMRSYKSDKSTTKEKEVPRMTHTSRTSACLSQKGPSMSLTLVRGSWCHRSFSSKITKLLWRKTFAESVACKTPTDRMRFLSKGDTKPIRFPALACNPYLIGNQHCEKCRCDLKKYWVRRGGRWCSHQHSQGGNWWS